MLYLLVQRHLVPFRIQSVKNEINLFNLCDVMTFSNTICKQPSSRCFWWHHYTENIFYTDLTWTISFCKKVQPTPPWMKLSFSSFSSISLTDISTISYYRDHASESIHRVCSILNIKWWPPVDVTEMPQSSCPDG